MHGHDCTGSRSNLRLNVSDIHRKGRSIDVTENRRTLSTDYGVRGRDKGEARHNYLVAFIQIQYHRRHFERVSAGCREQDMFQTKLFTQPCLDAFTYYTIAAKFLGNNHLV